jgi:hypothetical protein
MSVTENYADDSSDEEVERSETKVDDRRVGDEKEVELGTPTAAADLNATNLEQHNKNMEEGGDTHEFNNHRNSSSDECDSETKTQVGAGLFFGLSGLLIGGPIFGVLTGTGAAIVASKDKGVAGDVARATGDFAVVTGSKVGEAAKEVNEKHGVVDKIVNAVVTAWGRFQQFDEEHKISEKTKESMSVVSQKTVEFENKHHLMEHILGGIQSGVNFLLVKLKDATGGESDAGNGRSREY